MPRNQLHLVDFVMSIKGTSAQQMFASNGFAYPPQAIGKWLKRYIILTTLGSIITP